jgi:uncharacterized membrane protein
MNYFLIVLFSLLCLPKGYAQERIISYHSDIRVERSGALLVTEHITVQANGDQIKRGIYRSFPTSYKNKMGTRFRVDFDVVSVERDGTTEHFFTEKEGNGVVVYIGDKNSFLSPGVYAYAITYRTTRQIGFFEEYDELYFNAIGGDWTFVIEQATVSLTLPEGASVMQSAVYSGQEGATGCACTLKAEGNEVTISTTLPLQPREQLTFAVAWPKGIVEEPTAFQKTASFFADNFHVLFALLGLSLTTFLYYKAWKKVGIDPPKGTIIPLFDPPEGFSPADTSFLHQMSLSQRAISAAIVHMAVKGHLKIINEKKTYRLERLTPDTTMLSAEEAAISTALFSKGDQIDLDNKNHSAFSSSRAKANTLLNKKMQPKYFSLNYKHLVKGIIASVVLVIFTFMLSPTPVVPFIFIIFLIGLIILFTYLIKAPTTEGRALMDDIEGFKMYLSVAEQQQLNALHEPDLTVERFEALLPYAMALGVENKWGAKFENALARTAQDTSGGYSPTWYAGTGMMAFSPQKFSSDMGKSFSSAISSASTPPGSSSGSGGGGSSGGGGGGGGGGGW